MIDIHLNHQVFSQFKVESVGLVIGQDSRVDCQTMICFHSPLEEVPEFGIG